MLVTWVTAVCDTMWMFGVFLMQVWSNLKELLDSTHCPSLLCLPSRRWWHECDRPRSFDIDYKHVELQAIYDLHILYILHGHSWKEKPTIVYCTFADIIPVVMVQGFLSRQGQPAEWINTWWYPSGIKVDSVAGIPTCDIDGWNPGNQCNSYLITVYYRDLYIPGVWV